jgi:hypothetical protein
MVKLPGGVHAVRAARLPDALVFICAWLTSVQFQLHWTFNVLAIFPCLIIYVPFNRHVLILRNLICFFQIVTLCRPRAKYRAVDLGDQGNGLAM